MARVITFTECVLACLMDSDYVVQWARLRGFEPVDVLLALNHDGRRALADLFIADVRDLVWDRLPPDSKTGGPEGPPVSDGAPQ